MVSSYTKNILIKKVVLLLKYPDEQVLERIT